MLLLGVDLDTGGHCQLILELADLCVAHAVTLSTMSCLEAWTLREAGGPQLLLQLWRNHRVDTEKTD